MSDERPTTLVSGNQKGGVGKTTNTINLAAGLGEVGKRVLVIDTDSECCCTRGLGVNPEEHAGFLEVAAGHFTIPDVLLTDRMPPNVHLVASSPSVSAIANHIKVPPAEVLRPHIDSLRGYDFVIIDTPPSAGAIQTTAAYASADWIILSLMASLHSYDAMINALQRTVSQIQQVNPSLDVLGVLVSNVDSRSKDWERHVLQPMTGLGVQHLLFKNRIRQHRLITQCEAKGITLFQERTRHYRANHTILEDYRGLVQEVLYRIENADDFLDGKLIDLPLGYAEGEPSQRADEDAAPVESAEDTSKSESESNAEPVEVAVNG